MPSKERQGKWQPFDALEGYKTSLRNVEYEKTKIPKPILLPDELEQLNYRLIHAIEENKTIKVIYYKDGFNYEIEGEVTKVNNISKEITINDQTIKLNCINNIIEI